MFEAPDTDFAPWYVARSDDRKRARPDIISHLLSRVPCKQTPHEKVSLPKHQQSGSYRDPGHAFKFIPKKS